MRNKETGEFELVVGDRQLLSGFFIVVLLLAVVFAMGYVVGQNSPHSAKTDTAASTPPVPARRIRRQRPRPRSPPLRRPLPRRRRATPPNRPRPNRRRSRPPKPRAQEAPASSPAAAEPAAAPAPAGSYWQVMACKNPLDAQDLLQTLKDGGMPAFLRSEPDNLAHLVVGPYSDTQSKAKAKNDLESRFGLHPIPQIAWKGLWYRSARRGPGCRSGRARAPRTSHRCIA